MDEMDRKKMYKANIVSSSRVRKERADRWAKFADYLRNKITRDLTEGMISKYFCLISDEVTDTTTNKEVLSLC